MRYGALVRAPPGPETDRIDAWALEVGFEWPEPTRAGPRGVVVGSGAPVRCNEVAGTLGDGPHRFFARY